MTRDPVLARIPPTLFACVIGVSGLGLAWRQAAVTTGLPGSFRSLADTLALGLTAGAGMLLVLVAALYGAKVLRFPSQARADAVHPAQANFLAGLPIGAMLVAQGLILSGSAQPVHDLGAMLWWLAAPLQALVAAYTVARWIAQDQDVCQLNPSWFIPVAGNLVAPAGAVMMGAGEVGWFFFSVGVTFWLVLFTITFYRILFHDPLPVAACPTLAILIAPPALAFLAHMALHDGIPGDLGRMFLHVSIFLACVVLALARRFLRLPFSLSWWAYTFPLATLASALFAYARAEAIAWLVPTAVGLLVFASMVVAMTAFLTVRAAWAGTLLESSERMENAHAFG